MSARIPETKRTFLSPGDMQVTSSAHKRDRSVPQQMFFVSAIRPKITTRCRDQSPLPLRVPSLSAVLHLSNPTHTADGWKKARKEREENPPTILSRHESTSGAARSCLRVAVSMSQRSRLVSSLSLSRLFRIPVSHPPRRCPDFSEVLRSASAVRLSSPFRLDPSSLSFALSNVF